MARPTLAAVKESCRDFAETLGVDLQFLQSNHEGALVDWIHEARHTGRCHHHQPGRLFLLLDLHP